MFQRSDEHWWWRSQLAHVTSKQAKNWDSIACESRDTEKGETLEKCILQWMSVSSQNRSEVNILRSCKDPGGKIAEVWILSLRFLVANFIARLFQS